MSKEEQFEHIENKIKQAAENNQPAFDEKAWDKMQALLDKDKKKPKAFWLWFLLPLLLAGTGSIYFYSYKNSSVNSHKNIARVTEKKNTLSSSENSGIVKEQTIPENTPHLPTKKIPVPYSEKPVLIKEKQIAENILPEKINRQIKKTVTGIQVKVKSKLTTAAAGSNITTNSIAVDEKADPYNNGKKVTIKGEAKTKITASGNELVGDVTITDKKLVNSNEVADIKRNMVDSISVIVNDEKRPDINIKQEKKDQSAKVKKKSSPFYLLGLLGADIGSVKLFSFNNSSVTAKYGVGVGYQLNKKWSVQTGFYAGNKKYAAGPNDYHPKEHSYWSYVTITKVNAECMVYEIPVTVRYNFLKKSSVSYYAAIGLSSYLMKEEDYNYYYMWNNVPKEKYIIYTGNEHLFSTLSFSAGIEKKISSVLSLQLEPSVSLPLSGVGEGKVKLFSTAIMLGVKYLPF